MAVREASLDIGASGSAPNSDGWFVLNAKEARWSHAPGRSASCDFEGAARFADLGINISVLEAGEPMAMYHWEADQEDFLVLAGTPLLIVEGTERTLAPWDFVHCPAGTRHVIVGAGERACLVLAVGGRARSAEGDWGAYTVDPVAIRHGAGVKTETTDPREAYAGLPRRQATRYCPGWPPD